MASDRDEATAMERNEWVAPTLSVEDGEAVVSRLMAEVERLRAELDEARESAALTPKFRAWMWEAQDEVERLREAVKVQARDYDEDARRMSVELERAHADLRIATDAIHEMLVWAAAGLALTERDADDGK